MLVVASTINKNIDMWYNLNINKKDISERKHYVLISDSSGWWMG